MDLCTLKRYAHTKQTLKCCYEISHWKQINGHIVTLIVWAM
jgi:hypothetical protein